MKNKIQIKIISEKKSLNEQQSGCVYSYYMLKLLYGHNLMGFDVF